MSVQVVELALCWRYEGELKRERDNVSSWTIWSSEDEDGDGTRSESREGTRWMGKHVGVDFVDSTQLICPTWINSTRLLSVYSLPILPLFIPFSIADMILPEYERETTHEIGGLAAILWWRSLSFSFSPKSLSLDCFRLNIDIFPSLISWVRYSYFRQSLWFHLATNCCRCLM
jgi:hypothetical protein